MLFENRKVLNPLTILGVPDIDDFVCAATSEQLAAAVPGYIKDMVCVAFKRIGEFTVTGMEYIDKFIGPKLYILFTL